MSATAPDIQRQAAEAVARQAERCAARAYADGPLLKGAGCEASGFHAPAGEPA